MTRKHISELFFNAEIECEARSSNGNLLKWKFKKDNDIETFMEEVVNESSLCLYQHVQSEQCPEIGK